MTQKAMMQGFCLLAMESVMLEKTGLLFCVVVATVGIMLALDDLLYTSAPFTIGLALFCEALFIYAVFHILRKAR